MNDGRHLQTNIRAEHGAPLAGGGPWSATNVSARWGLQRCRGRRLLSTLCGCGCYPNSAARQGRSSVRSAMFIETAKPQTQPSSVGAA